MSGDEWPSIFRRVSAAGLMAGRSVKERLLATEDLDAILAAARAAGRRGMLDDAMLDELAAMVEAEAAAESAGTTTAQADPEGREWAPVEAGASATEAGSSTVAVTAGTAATEGAGGRVIAPMGDTEPTPPRRLHGLADFRLEDFPIDARDIDAEIEVHFDITGGSVTEGRKEDISACFNDRLKRLKRLILDGRLPNRVTPVIEATRRRSSFGSRDETVTMIGLVGECRHTKKGHLMFTLEDETAEVRCILNDRTAGAGEAALQRHLDAGLMNDDVIGVTGYFYGGDMLSVENIHQPPLRRHARRAAGEDRAVSVAFISDIHVGGKTFLEPQWHKMIQWFNTDPLARNIRYLVIAGDGVDGVGIYPGQEEELEIPDLFNQYTHLGRLLEGLPDHVDVILLPGNHDAVRPAEPQPALDPELQTDYNNTVFVGNPCDFSLHGVRVLSYHGVSIMDFVHQMRSVTFETPEAAMRAMLDRRHLAPSWGGKTPLSPEPEDRLVIQEIPDIFVTGHVHGHHHEVYKGVSLIHSSTWQDQTSYQRMLGFQPKPCILTVVNLHTHATAAIPFA